MMRAKYAPADGNAVHLPQAKVARKKHEVNDYS